MQNKNKNYFDQITDFANIKQAFLELKENFYNPMTRKYALGQLARGIDGDCFAIFGKSLTKNIELLQRELKNFKTPLPSIDLKIPKSSNPSKFRTISISAFKEKIKHQAICRVIEPVLESLYADNLYSYRPAKGAYQAIKDFRKVVLFDEDEFYVYKLDMKDYFDNLDHEIVAELVDKHFGDANLSKLIGVFMKQPRLDANSLISSSKGVVQGIAISAHMANLYLMELDLDMEKRGMNYFRVGDDVIVLEKDLEVLKKVASEVEEFLVGQRKLVINMEKTSIFSPDEAFEYLGYEIKNKDFKIAKRNCERMKQKIRLKLNKKLTEKICRKTVDQNQLLSEIMGLIFPGKRIPDHLMWLRYFLLTNDVSQLQEMDNFIENRIRLVFFGKQRNKSLTLLPLKKLRKHSYVSISKVYFDITRGRKSFSDYVKVFTKA